MRVLSDPLAFIRGHSERFFVSGRFSAPELMGMIACEALFLGASRLNVVQSEGWWGVCADVDWLPCKDEASSREFFRRIVPMTQAGPNSMYVGVVATAFADSVWTKGMSYAASITGTEPPRSVAEPGVGWERILAFSGRESRCVGLRDDRDV